MKLFKCLQETNYGQYVALIAANSLEEAKELIRKMEKGWDLNDIEEVIISDTPCVMSINGGNQG